MKVREAARKVSNVAELIRQATPLISEVTEKCFRVAQRPVGAMWKVSGALEKAFPVAWKTFLAIKKDLFVTLKVGGIEFSYGTACASKRVISRTTRSLARPVP